MFSRRTFTIASLAWTATNCGIGQNVYGARLSFTSAHSRLEADAAKEGALRIDSATDLSGVEDLLESFKQLYPSISLEYRRSSSADLHKNFLQEVSTGGTTADIVLSSAMDLQFKLVNDGFAQTYESPQKQYLPESAVWKDQAYVICADPLVFAYNKALMPAADVPDSHHELVDLLRRKSSEYRGKIATYDPEKSGTGYLYYTQDLLLSRDTLDLVQAVGRTQPHFYALGGAALDKVSSGEHVFVYNMVNSSMIVRQLRDANLGIVFPSDYTLVMSRVAFIPKMAKHPASGKLFLDFLLSQLGQTLLARHYMQPIRNDVPIGWATPSTEVQRWIHFGPALLANLDEFRRRRVLQEWRRILAS
jgi:iron(III) transport system substrate-binding protein